MNESSLNNQFEDSEGRRFSRPEGTPKNDEKSKFHHVTKLEEPRPVINESFYEGDSIN